MPAAKKRPAPSPADRAIQDRVTRARKSYPRFDRHGGYREACAQLAEETGCDVEAAYEEFLDRVSTKLYLGTIEVEDAESAAMTEICDRFRAAS